MRLACACLPERFASPCAFLHPRFVRIPRFEFPVREYASFESTHNSNTNRDRTYAISSPVSRLPLFFSSLFFSRSFPPSCSRFPLHIRVRVLIKPLPFSHLRLFFVFAPFICVRSLARFVCAVAYPCARVPCINVPFSRVCAGSRVTCLHAMRVSITPRRKRASELALRRSPALRATLFISFFHSHSFHSHPHSFSLVVFPCCFPLLFPVLRVWLLRSASGIASPAPWFAVRSSCITFAVHVLACCCVAVHGNRDAARVMRSP